MPQSIYYFINAANPPQANQPFESFYRLPKNQIRRAISLLKLFLISSKVIILNKKKEISCFKGVEIAWFLSYYKIQAFSIPFMYCHIFLAD